MRQLVVSFMHPEQLSIKDFAYELPEERIARYPLAERDSSKLLIYKGGKIHEDVYKKIADHIPSQSLLVFNNTKVVEARLLFQKPSGGQIEIFCLEPADIYPDVTTGMIQREKVWWKCLVGGSSKWKTGQLLEKTINVNNQTIQLTAKYINKLSDSFIIELAWSPADLTFAEILHLAGAIPLPPYIKRSAELSDAERYQTIYAQFDGSVAAPTAGLHFTPFILQQLAQKKIETKFVTLHVGAGTFKPVKATVMKEHEMHAEFIDVSAEMIQSLLSHLDDTIIAVGTTSLRTIESIYWIGAKLYTDQPNPLHISQWDAYDLQINVSPQQALTSLLSWMKENSADRIITKTQIIIAPGYHPKIAKALVTNFHQPQSTLLLLIAALIGESWRKVYDHALENDFRFLSYGDGSLLWFK